MTIQTQLKTIPSTPGIYLFYNSYKKLIYVGKATSIKTRVRSYFTSGSTTNRPIEKLINQVKYIKYKKTDSVLEAIILESIYIKKYKPKYNIEGKDDKSWNYLIITNDLYPTVQFIREHELSKHSNKLKRTNLIFGPFPGLNSSAAIKIFRKLFNLSTCNPQSQKPCFYYHIKQCLGVCTAEINPTDYKNKVIHPLITFLKGNKLKLITNLKKKMENESKKHNFEEAIRLRDQIKNLKKIHDSSLLNKNFFSKNHILPYDHFTIQRLEAYDISNLGETNKVGSMVVFNETGPIKSAYRKFRIKTVTGQSDTDCLSEILTRRLSHINCNWPKPDIILVDGGKPQVNSIKKVLQYYNLNIPLIGIAKGKQRKKNEFIFDLPQKDIVKNKQKLLIQARDEAHRFAITYQRNLRKIA